MQTHDTFRLLIGMWVSAILVFPRMAHQRAPATSAARYDFASVRSFLQKTIAEKQLPSVSVAVAKAGKIVWEESFGWADREKMVPTSPDTMYALASLTKPYTSTGVMELMEQHKVELDHAINEYLGSASLTAIAGETVMIRKWGTPWVLS